MGFVPHCLVWPPSAAIVFARLAMASAIHTFWAPIFDRAWAPLLVSAALLAPTTAAAADDEGIKTKRRGGQWSMIVGGSACVPGQAACGRDTTTDGIAVDGTTRPSLATGGELGYRINPYVFVGSAYRFGMFDMAMVNIDGLPYELGYQHSIFGVVRPSIPLWRFDLGLTLGPGYSRQVFRLPGTDRDYSAGFSWMMGPVLDLFLTERVFVGLRADLLLNAQGKVCEQRAGTTTCVAANSQSAGPVHQLIFGLHVGGTFL